MNQKKEEGRVYKTAVKGKLTFKGDSKAISIPKSSLLGKRKTTPSLHTVDQAEEDQTEIQIQNGIGRITSSGNTIHGHETQFMSQLSVNDAIIITHPTTLLEETKIVRMVLSNISIGISSAFSSDLISTTPFRYVKAPKDPEDTDEKQRKEIEKRDRSEEAAFGTYASKGGSQFTYRVKKGGAFGGYQIVTENTSSALTREELLDRRSKKKSDRHCY